MAQWAEWALATLTTRVRVQKLYMPIYCSLKRKKLKKEKEAGNDACKKVIPKAMELFSRRR